MNNNNRSNNSNNNNNNRRRGRGNNRQGGGGGQQLNRIDSRARGNAPQMLEKYRKLAHDAHLNGDRVAEEYNLQFAEHYFRVIADQRLRQEEQRGGGTRPNDRFDGNGEQSEQDDGGEYAEAEYQPYDQSAFQRPQQSQPREDRPQREERQERASREDRSKREDRPERPNQGQQGQGQERQERQDRPERTERPERNFNRADRVTEEPVAEAPVPEVAAEPAFEPPENPFVRGSRGLKPRREDRRPRREDRDEAGSGEPEGLSLSLPPAISVRSEPEVAESEAAVEPKPKARRAPRKPKPSADGETLEAVS